MKRNTLKYGLMAAASLAAVVSAKAQLPVGSYTPNNDEILLGFTVPGSSGDLVIDLGTATQVGVGGSTTVDLIAHNNVGISASALQSQLNSLYGTMDGLQWGLVGGHYNGPFINAVYSTVPHGAPPPGVYGAPGQVIGAINTAGQGLNDFAGTPSNQGTVDPTQGFGESWTEIIAPGTLSSSFSLKYYNPNSTTPGGFSSGGPNFQMEDLYFSSATATNPVLKGVITLGSDGSLTFAPSTGVVAVPPFLRITRTNNTSTISFLTTNGVTYTLYYTNSPGLKTSITAGWPSSPTTITGNNATNSFVDTTTDPVRIYRVGAH
jgi:hypothetical protein